ncbi:hypothetical protein D3C71_1650320 [compost metagenome]
MDNFGRAISVHRQVVPGRHHLWVFGLAWVKTGADIGIGAGEYQQCFAAVLKVLPLAVGPGQVGIHSAEIALGGIDQHR